MTATKPYDFFCQSFLFSPLYYSLSNSYLFYNKFAFSFSEKETKKLLSSWKEVRSSKAMFSSSFKAMPINYMELRPILQGTKRNL